MFSLKPLPGVLLACAMALPFPNAVAEADPRSSANWRPIGKVKFSGAAELQRSMQERVDRLRDADFDLSGIDDGEDEPSRLVAVHLPTGMAYEQVEIRPYSAERLERADIADATGTTTELEPFTGDEQKAPGRLPATRDIVGGTDDRTRYLDMTSYPHRTIGGIAPKGSLTSSCSGALVGPRHVLTAAHCIHPGGGGTDRFFANQGFAPGWKGRGDSAQTKPNGHYNPEWYYAPKGWWQDHDDRYDYAIIVLEDSSKLRGLGYLGAREGNAGNLLQRTIRNRGYPGANRSCSASPTGTCDNFMYGMSCKGQGVGVRQFSHNCDTQPGQSGSPLFKTDNYIYGIHIQEGLTFNWAVKMRDNVLDLIEDARAARP